MPCCPAALNDRFRSGDAPHKRLKCFKRSKVGRECTSERPALELAHVVDRAFGAMIFRYYTDNDGRTPWAGREPHERYRRKAGGQ